MDKSIEQLLLGRENPLGRGRSVVFPDYTGYCIANIPSLIGSVLGIDDDSSATASLGERFGDYERVVFLILDGFGYRKAQALFQEYPDSVLKELGEDGCQVPLTSVYPSTTVSALTSLSTGLTPLEHGMIGYRLYLREIASITNMIRFTTLGNSRPESAFAIGLDPQTLIPQPTFHGHLDASGVSTHSVLPHHISASGLSTTLYRGCTKVHPAVSLPDMLVRTRDILQKSRGKTFISLYWPGLDSVAHALGPDSESYRAEFRAVDDAVRRGLVGQVKDTLLIVSSDHGFVPMAPDDYLLLNSEFDADRALLMPPVGEPRASYLFTRDGSKDAILQAFSEARDDGLLCIESKELIETGLLGINTPHPEIANRIGDLALLSTGSAGTFQDYPDAVLLRGMHGGLTEDEMLVPLIIAAL
ncbi:alkaline phosphatase family protein [Candidatus Bipolaricaulota bacterium]